MWSLSSLPFTFCQWVLAFSTCTFSRTVTLHVLASVFHSTLHLTLSEHLPCQCILLFFSFILLYSRQRAQRVIWGTYAGDSGWSFASERMRYQHSILCSPLADTDLRIFFDKVVNFAFEITKYCLGVFLNTNVTCNEYFQNRVWWNGSVQAENPFTWRHVQS